MSAIQYTLKKQLETHGISAGALAKKAGVPISSIKNLLQGKVENPRYDTITALAGALGVPVDSLMHKVESNLPTPSKQKAFEAELFEDALSALAPIYKEAGTPFTKEDAYSLLDETYEYACFHLEQQQSRLSIETLHSFARWLVMQRSERL